MPSPEQIFSEKEIQEMMGGFQEQPAGFSKKPDAPPAKSPDTKIFPKPPEYKPPTSPPTRAEKIKSAMREFEELIAPTEQDEDEVLKNLARQIRERQETKKRIDETLAGFGSLEETARHAEATEEATKEISNSVERTRPTLEVIEGRQDRFELQTTELPEHVAIAGDEDEGTLFVAVGDAKDPAGALHAELMANAATKYFKNPSNPSVEKLGDRFRLAIATKYAMVDGLGQNRTSNRISQEAIADMKPLDAALTERQNTADTEIVASLSKRLALAVETVDPEDRGGVVEKVLAEKANVAVLEHLSIAGRKALLEQLKTAGITLNKEVSSAVTKPNEYRAPSLTAIRINNGPPDAEGKIKKMLFSNNVGNNRMMIVGRDGSTREIPPKKAALDDVGEGGIQPWANSSADSLEVNSGDQVLVIPEGSPVPTAQEIGTAGGDLKKWIEERGVQGAILFVK